MSFGLVVAIGAYAALETFENAKNVARKYIYLDRNHDVNFYCGCDRVFSNNGSSPISGR